MSVRRIVLRGPWRWERLCGDELAHEGSSPRQGQINLPVDGANTLGEPGLFRFVRRFGRPTLPEGEQAVLVVATTGVSRSIRLNGAELPRESPEGPCRADVTGQLPWRSELVVELDLSAPLAAEPPLAAWLELGPRDAR